MGGEPESHILGLPHTAEDCKEAKKDLRNYLRKEHYGSQGIKEGFGKTA